MITKITRITPKRVMNASTPPAARILPIFLGAGVATGVGDGVPSSSPDGVGAGPSSVSNGVTFPCIISVPDGVRGLLVSSFVT